MSNPSIEVSLINQSNDRNPISIVVFKSDPEERGPAPVLAWLVIPYLMVGSVYRFRFDSDVLYVAGVQGSQIRDGELVDQPVFQGSPVRVQLPGSGSVDIVIRGGGPPPPPPPPPPFDIRVEGFRPA
jgi:hypothetical protein